MGQLLGGHAACAAPPLLGRVGAAPLQRGQCLARAEAPPSCMTPTAAAHDTSCRPGDARAPSAEDCCCVLPTSASADQQADGALPLCARRRRHPCVAAPQIVTARSQLRQCPRCRPSPAARPVFVLGKKQLPRLWAGPPPTASLLCQASSVLYYPSTPCLSDSSWTLPSGCAMHTNQGHRHARQSGWQGIRRVHVCHQGQHMPALHSWEAPHVAHLATLGLPCKPFGVMPAAAAPCRDS